MSLIQTKALILRHSTDREHDRVLVILTPQLGQQRVKARGTKKSVSKLGGSLEPLMEVDLTLADGRVMRVVTGSVIHNRFPTLRSDVVTMTMAQWLLELVEGITKPEQPTESLYGLVVSILTSMGQELSRPLGQQWLALCRQALDLLVHEGFVPALDRCSVCHRPLGDESVSYHPHQGFVHSPEAHDGALELAVSTMAYLQSGVIPADERAVFRQAHELIERLIHHTLDRPLKSERVLRSVARIVPQSR